MKHLKIAATADGGLTIEGYGVPFGGPIKGKDLHGQFFSKKTDFALDLIPEGQRPLLYQHGLDSNVDTAVIGRWGVKRIDDGGVWVRAQLDARSEYINEIKELVNQDALGFSSGTMGHLVKVSSKTGEILKWALVELSLTPNPANPNAYIVKANKSAAAHVKSLFGTKHGDHDQSEHGNWAHSDGGARASNEAEMNRRNDPAYQEKHGIDGRFDGGPKSEKAGNALISLAEKSGIHSTQTESMRSQFEKLIQLKKEGYDQQAQTIAANIRDAGSLYGHQSGVAEKHGEITDDHGISRSPEELTKLGNVWKLLSGHAWDIAYAPSAHDIHMEKYNDWMSGYDVPGFPKSLRIKRS